MEQFLLEPHQLCLSSRVSTQLFPTRISAEAQLKVKLEPWQVSQKKSQNTPLVSAVNLKNAADWNQTVENLFVVFANRL